MTVRPGTEVLRLMLAEAQAHTARVPGGYPQAVAETLAWVLGDLHTAPLSGTRTNSGPPTEDQLLSEYREAEHWAYQGPECSVPQYHVVGVESTLMWVCGLTTIKPLEFIHTEPPGDLADTDVADIDLPDADLPDTDLPGTEPGPGLPGEHPT